MAPAETLNIAHLRSWIGHEDIATEHVGAEIVRRFHATFEEPTDEPRRGDTAPQLLHFCLTQPAAQMSALGEDGHPARGGFLPPIPLPRRMWAGSTLTFHSDLKIGETVRRVSHIADVVLKEGRTGPLCLVTVQHDIDADGRAILSESQTIVYLGLGDAAKTAAAPAPEGRHRQEVAPSTPLLFRYSAITFNGHRIHYDRAYATQAEGYPGLVVHGPLQATLLLRYAAELRVAPLARFTFRSLSPLFDTEPFLMHAVEEGDRLKLWTACTGGPIAMMAEAGW
ncbi:MaoC family dehydratase N-terminal domain-containing protein [Aquabacter sp. CN5-332]|uniref:FAS1-like dehydratase domain-containing protein n=1 Tax=Aquabacter sp. CN5-332 TaxID=3156608 RepID=UPI0032B4D04A